MTVPFAEYRGERYVDLVDDAQRAGLTAWAEILRLGCGDLVDGAYFIESQIYLCEATADYIYSDYTPTVVAYRAGSRPMLEKIVAGLRLEGKSEFERFLWLARFVRDLPTARAWDLGEDHQNGGTEEELIAKRADVCNEQARLLVVLSQVAGLPARYVGHHIGGHGVTEVYLDGGWRYYDTRGRFFLKADGQMASTWEIWRDPSIIRRQPDWVRREIHPRYDTRISVGAYFHPKECTGIVNYFVGDRDRFNYARDWPMSDEARRRVRELVKQRNEARRTLGMYHPEAYSQQELETLFTE